MNSRCIFLGKAPRSKYAFVVAGIDENTENWEGCSVLFSWSHLSSMFPFSIDMAEVFFIIEKRFLSYSSSPSFYVSSSSESCEQGGVLKNETGHMRKKHVYYYSSSSFISFSAALLTDPNCKHSSRPQSGFTGAGQKMCRSRPAQSWSAAPSRPSPQLLFLLGGDYL